MASAPQRTAADDVEALITAPDAMPPATRISVEAVRESRAAAPTTDSPGTSARVLPPPLNAGAGGGSDAIGKGRFAGATITRMVVTFYPHPHLWIVRPVSFEMRISMAFPANPPSVRCTDEAFVLEFGARANLDSAGKPALHVLSTESLGWNRTYTLADAIHCVRRCLFRTGAPVVTVVPAPPTTVTTSGNAGAVGSPGGGTFCFTSTGAQVPLSTRTGSFMGFSDPALAADIAALGSSARSRRGSVSSTVEGMAPLRSPSSAALHLSPATAAAVAGGSNSSPKASGHSGAGILAGQSLLGTFGSMSSMSGHLSVGRSGTTRAASPAKLAGAFPAPGSSGSSPESADKADGAPAVTAATHTYRRRRSGDASADGSAPAAAGAGAGGKPPGEGVEYVGLNSDPSTRDLHAAAAGSGPPKTPPTAASAGTDAPAARTSPDGSPAAASNGSAGASSSSPSPPPSAGAAAAAAAAVPAARRRASSGLVTSLPVGGGARPGSGGSLRSASSAANLLHTQSSHRTPRGSVLPSGPLVKLQSAHSGMQVSGHVVGGGGGGGGGGGVGGWSRLRDVWRLHQPVAAASVCVRTHVPPTTRALSHSPLTRAADPTWRTPRCGTMRCRWPSRCLRWTQPHRRRRRP
jgi:hypothetical protein